MVRGVRLLGDSCWRLELPRRDTDETLEVMAEVAWSEPRRSLSVVLTLPPLEITSATTNIALLINEES
jgi:hypothetical protein